MRAIRVAELGNPDVLKVEQVPTPEPASDEVLIEIKAIGVNPVDTYIRSGYQGYNPTVPYTPGYDAAGVVVGVGDKVNSFDVGARVYLSGAIDGTYAEFALCKVNQINPIPDHMTFAEGACLFVAYVTAYRGLVQRAKAITGETVLIHGASGAVGIAAIQFAKLLGCRVIASAGTKEGQRLAAEQGADLVVDHNDSDHYSSIMDYTEAAGVHIILEMMAHLNLANDLKILAAKGRVVIVGSRDTIEINPRDTMACDGEILGMSLMNISESEQIEIHKAIADGIHSKKLKPIIRCELPLEEAALAHIKMMEPGALGKIILIP